MRYTSGAGIEGVERFHVFEESLARLRGWNQHPVEINILAMTVVGADTDHVALVGANVNEFILPVETTDGEIALADLFPCLDGKTERRPIGKLETHDRMRHVGRAPEVDRQVEAGDLRKSYGARFPTWYVVGLGAVITIADVVQCDFVAVAFRSGSPSDIGLPVAVVARLQREPPQCHDREAAKNGSELSYSSANKNHGREQNEREHDGGRAAERGDGEIKIERACCPSSTK